MNPELIVATLLNVNAVNTLVGTRKALGQLPQGTAYPALVYQVITGVPQPVLNYTTAPQMAQARIQINPLAVTIGEVKAIHAAVRISMDFTLSTVVAGKKIVSCRFENIGFADRDNEAGIWTQAADFMLQYYE